MRNIFVTVIVAGLVVAMASPAVAGKPSELDPATMEIAPGHAGLRGHAPGHARQHRRL